MSVLERVPAQARRRTGWILPIAVGSLIGMFVPESARVIGQTERLWSGGLALAGLAAGLLWQWYSPRDLAERLFFPSAALMAFAVIFMLPGGEWSSASPGFAFWFPLGVVAGLVLMSRQQRRPTRETEVKEEQSPGT
ncbi:hypothetical protein AB0F43_29520 [Kribbella sp. NPDC023972]|uniref:hypothetical protein n=1 Tax=Kribbella sp. NPDC023972 TaxID=3154795 RepID=UPI0033F17B03